MPLSHLWPCSSELVPQKGRSSGYYFNFQVSPVLGSIVLVFWENSVSGIGIVLSTWSYVVAGDTWVSQSRRKSSGKFQSSFSFSPSLMNPSKSIYNSRWVRWVVVFGVTGTINQCGEVHDEIFLSVSNPMTDVRGDWLVVLYALQD